MTETSQAIISGPGEGERLESEDRVYLVKVARPELSLIEYDTGPTYSGASPHFHERHTDAFFLLEGELEFTLGRETHLGRAGTAVVVPPGNVHAFTSHGSGRARFLNIHAPDSGFTDFLRARTRGEDASFDSVDVDGPQEPGEGTVLGPGEGTTYVVGTATSVFKATREATAGAFSLAEVTIQPGTSGPPPTSTGRCSTRSSSSRGRCPSGSATTSWRRRPARTPAHRRASSTPSPTGALPPCASST